MKIFVTGADGLLGSHVVRKLLARNYSVCVFIQPGRNTSTLDGLNIERSNGDISDYPRLKNAVAGCDGIIHIAAVTSVWPAKDPIYKKINVDGVANIINAALAHNVKKVVHIGSAAAFGYGSKENPGTELSPFRSAKYGIDYITTKKQGQDLVLEAVKKRGLPAVVACPTFMVGPYDCQPSSGAMLLAVAKKQLTSYSRGGRNWIAASDVAEGICNALEKGRIGECYIMGNKNLSYKEAFALIAKTIQVKPPRILVPDFLVKSIGLFGSLYSAFSGNNPKISLPIARASCDGHYFSAAKAVEELDLPQTSLEIAVSDTVSWFREHGYLE
ncbi:MAG: NAD-dependent epimerase/dehydratase family protein [Candidatus Brocadiales bacterium]|nr:NAD-dependent epimerase/dehydratase family protein [Candidatus Brocadiales bacterium]MBL7005766.1 NAD-dependent epimerase/dehydratase family protein [Spirochaetia bacterium]